MLLFRAISAARRRTTAGATAVALATARCPALVALVDERRALRTSSAAAKSDDNGEDKRGGGVGWLSEDGRKITEGKGQFGAFAAEYDKYRPSYPAELWQTILRAVRGASQPPRPEAAHQLLTAADIGAGTGRGAAALLKSEHVGKVIAVEPDRGMLDQCKQSLDALLRSRDKQVQGKDVVFVEGSGESTHLEDASVDVAVCLQAWHWVDNAKGMAEMRRVLKPHGFLAVVWNDRDLADPLISCIEDHIERYNPDYDRSVRQCDGKEAELTANDAFRLALREDIAHTLSLPSLEDVLALTHTFSYVKNVLTPEELSSYSTELRAGLKELLLGDIATQKQSPIELPLLARLYLLQKQD